MYQPAHFAPPAADACATLMREHPLATLVTQQDGEFAADAVPLLYDPAASLLRGHVARANPLWRRADGQPVLAVFNGPQAYVSPGWYPSKATNPKVVPTWNYAVVHAHGTLRAVDDAAWLLDFLRRFTAVHEADQRRPWSVDDAPVDYLQQMAGAIVGIEISVARIEGKFKLSQNRSAADRAGVVAGLEARQDRGSLALATLMSRA
ncbi:MAG: FMN-binding negative transcriptional regulator [Burkholderiales bacterium]|nr:FMN-binding negative transcriptional regulator [Burkholderiales bacterium]MDE1927496.1 FMN-binding negative transcriptional regulator [Burkholderiales bacterium]MDE2157894.1 FMN-binding negative transcriptional regulator [Burkholderiales bacterium]MDE2502294.1 FMN-binding negative transcriptional regulator [Burkholderiales bacterium]